MSMQSNSTLLRITGAWYILYFTYGLFPIVVGIDKCFNLIADWHLYLNPAIPLLLHVDMSAFMYVLAAVEVMTGLLVFIKPLWGGYAIMALLILVIIELLSLGIYLPQGYMHMTPQYDTALRALAMLMGAWVFVILTKEIKRVGSP